MDVSANPRTGRPRDQQARLAILAAALTLLVDRGYAGFALEAVARHAGVAKTTIYRWWPNRAALAVEAFFDHTEQALAFPNTGSAAGDFRSQLKQLAAILRGQPGQVLAALIIGSRHDPQLQQAIEQRWVAPRRRWGLARMQQAIAEGETPASLHLFTALDTLYSPLYNHLFLGIPVHSDQEIDRLCDLLFPSIFPTKPSTA